MGLATSDQSRQISSSSNAQLFEWHHRETGREEEEEEEEGKGIPWSSDKTVR